MKLKNLLTLALFAALIASLGPLPAFAQDDLPVAKDADAKDDENPNGDMPKPPPPPAEGEEDEAEDETPAFMPTGKIAGAYEPTADERNAKNSAQSLKIAENGRALVPIVISSRAGRATHDTVKELAMVLNRITGATFEVRYSDGKPYDYNPPAPARSSVASRKAAEDARVTLYVANAQKPAEQLPQSGLVLGTAEEWVVPDVDIKTGLAMRGAFHGREAFAIRSDAKRVLLIAGQDRGIHHAVVRFLEEIGCRWFGPGEHWEITPSIKNLSFGRDITDRPSIGSRIVAFMDGAYNGKERDDQNDWARHNYLGTSFSGGVGHMWHRFLENNPELFKQHPEYLAMLGGERVNIWRKDPKTGKEYIPKTASDWVKLELGNPAVRQMFVDYAIKTFKDNPDATMVNVSPNDGGGYSTSPEARALGDGSPSDQLFTMVNEVARALKKEFPGQGKMVGCYAYRDAAAPPSFPMEDNIYIELALGYNQSKYTSTQLLEMWPKKVKNMGVYEYWSIYDAGGSEIPGGSVSNIPRLATSIRQHYAQNVASLFAQSSNAFAMQMRGYLVGTRLMWNPNADVDAILADFYDRSFGPAKEPMKRFYVRLSPENPRHINSYTIAAAYRDLDEATRLAKGREDVLWRLGDLKLYLRWIYLRGQTGGKKAGSPEFEEAYQNLMRSIKQMQPTYMAQVNMIIKRTGRRNKNNVKGLDLTDTYTNLEKPTLESIEAGFQEALKTMPTQDIPYVDFDQTDLVPVVFPPAPAFVAAPKAAPVPAAPTPAADAEADAGPLMRGEYYQGNTPIYNFYSFKGEPIEVEVQAGVRGSGKSGRIQTWTLSQSDGKGGWKLIARGEIPADKSRQKLSLKVPGPGSYGFVFRAGSLAGYIRYNPEWPVTVVASGAKDFRGPYIYVPKGTKEIWMQYSSFSANKLTLQMPDGKYSPVMSSGVYTIPVPPGMDGQLWRVPPGQKFRGQEFYNIPNLAAPSPDTLMVPREVAVKDGLKIREK